MPVQDTPSNKITYSARVVAPTAFVVKMSANDTYIGAVDENTNESFFWCEIPIPNYLMAIAVGNIETK